VKQEEEDKVFPKVNDEEKQEMNNLVEEKMSIERRMKYKSTI